MKQDILKLRDEGKTYTEIKEILGCSKGTISYHCGKGQVEKTNLRSLKYKNNNPLINKVDKFRGRVRDFQRNRLNGTFIEGRDFNITVEDVIKKVGENPICYLTGRKIDLLKSNTYHLDHVVPVSKGGLNTLENLEIACKDANFAKRDLTKEEYLQLCIDTLIHNGYKLIKEDEVVELVCD